MGSEMCIRDRYNTSVVPRHNCDGTGRDGGCEFSRRDGTVQYKDLFVSGRDGTVNENWHDGTGR